MAYVVISLSNSILSVSEIRGTTANGQELEYQNASFLKIKFIGGPTQQLNALNRKIGPFLIVVIG